MAKDKEYDDYCIKAGIPNRNKAYNPAQQQADYRPTEVVETPAIVQAMAHLENQLHELRDRIHLLETQLCPIYGPLEAQEDRLGVPGYGNSPLAIKLNHLTGVTRCMTERVMLLTAALEI